MWSSGGSRWLELSLKHSTECGVVFLILGRPTNGICSWPRVNLNGFSWWLGGQKGRRLLELSLELSPEVAKGDGKFALQCKNKEREKRTWPCECGVMCVFKCDE